MGIDIFCWGVFRVFGGVFALLWGDLAFWGVISRFGGCFSRYATITSIFFGIFSAGP